jgi:hypothetical protein
MIVFYVFFYYYWDFPSWIKLPTRLQLLLRSGTSVVSPPNSVYALIAWATQIIILFSEWGLRLSQLRIFGLCVMTLKSGRWLSAFQADMVPPFSGLVYWIWRQNFLHHGGIRHHKQEGHTQPCLPRSEEMMQCVKLETIRGTGWMKLEGRSLE